MISLNLRGQATSAQAARYERRMSYWRWRSWQEQPLSAAETAIELVTLLVRELPNSPAPSFIGAGAMESRNVSGWLAALEQLRDTETHLPPDLIAPGAREELQSNYDAAIDVGRHVMELAESLLAHAAAVTPQELDKVSNQLAPASDMIEELRRRQVEYALLMRQ
jgi:hypothetical protein